MRWIRFVASLAGLLFASTWLIGLVFVIIGWNPDAAVFDWLFGLTAFTLFLGVPAAYLIAIFKHGLWDLDVVIKKAVVFGILVVLITGTAIALFLSVGALLTDAAPDETLAVGILMLLLGILIWPLRKLAGRIADRVVYGGRSTPYEVLTEFSGRVGQSYSTEDVIPRMAQILAEATGASTTRSGFGWAPSCGLKRRGRPGLPIPAPSSWKATKHPRSAMRMSSRSATRASCSARSRWTCLRTTH